MNDDWIEILLSGEYEVSVPTLTVSSDEIGTLNGGGHVTWDRESGIRIQAITNGAEKISSFFDGRVGKLGQLITHSTYLSFSGQTYENWQFAATRVPRGGHRTASNLPEVIWDLNTVGLTLSRETDRWKWRGLRILVGPLPDHWTRYTETEVRNGVFDSRRSAADWLLTECSLGRVAARLRSEDWFEVQVEPKIDQPMRNAFEVTNAVARAFGFVLGRRCVICGWEEITESKETRRLDTRYAETTTTSLLQPLGSRAYSVGNVECLLGLAIDFFLTELGERVAPYLYLCWDSADNFYQTRHAISSICVEGLLRVAAEILGPSQPKVDQADLDSFQKWLKSNPTGFSPAFLNRLGGLSGMFNSLSPKDIFRDWIDRGILEVTNDDLKAWSDLRNPAAHGRLSPTENQSDLQQVVDRHARVQNIINKVFLQLMGYQGVFIDYSKRNYPPAAFPYVQPQESQPIAKPDTPKVPQSIGPEK